MECTCENCLLCRNILPEWREVVKLKRDVLTYPKGTVIFEEGSEVKGVYFILKGKAKVHMKWGDKEYIVRLASDSTILGHRGFGLDSVYPVSATALEEITVCFIENDLFKTLLTTNNQFCTELMWYYADELKLTERRMRHLALMPVKGRIGESLVLIEKAFGLTENGFLAYPLARKDIASMAGTTYETVIRVFNEMVEDKWIELDKKWIKITDKKAIETCCRENKAEAVA